VEAGSLTLVDSQTFEEPSTKLARRFLEASGLSAPLVVVLNDDETNAVKSFRNLERVAIVAPSELEVSAVVWARSLVVSEAALPLVQTRATDRGTA
jgi:ribosomal protein L4